ncbi:MAG: ATP-binding cassette domain-containing protein [Deltaproteobacteria bacterium]|nr:ATP-binding cassette domain-containing protein [Deltaproteobacteria bacterium]
MIRVERVTHSYHVGAQPVAVLKDVELRIAEGELVAIKGSSGSGKSTLLYVLGCLLRPDKGRVVIDRRDLATLSDEELAVFRNRTLGFVFQQFHLLARASVVDNILLPASYPVELARDERTVAAQRPKAIELARSLGLGEHLHHLPNQLSGGQQQRVAIARALMNDAKVILADEPTGNLDSKNAAQIIELLRELNRKGKTVIIVTHDPAVAEQCDRICEIKDGEFIKDTGKLRAAAPESERPAKLPKPENVSPLRKYLATAPLLMPLAWENLVRTKARSMLTMLGIVIGIAAVLSMVTIGSFAKRKILEGYEELGVNKLNIKGWPNWQLRAVDTMPVKFRQFDWEKDIAPLRKIFPQIRLVSPVMNTSSNSIDFGGRSVTTDLRIVGVNHEFSGIANRQLAVGHDFSPYHIENRAAVCLVGSEIAQQLFAGTQPLGQIVFVQGGKSAFGCRVIGVLKPQNSNNSWNKPNLQLLIPYTYFRGVVENWWDEQIHEFVLQVSPQYDVERTGDGIRNFYTQKYGKSGRFDVGSDAILIAQMKKFLNIFSILLGSIALISLVVGGIGITNMMLVSVSELFKEIGLRKALGATDFSIRVQFLLESVILCIVAGLIGMLLGFSAYEIMIYSASKFVPKLRFEWVFEPGAFLLSVVSILAVGIASGLVPAVRAEKLEVIEALRSE